MQITKVLLFENWFIKIWEKKHASANFFLQYQGDKALLAFFFHVNIKSVRTSMELQIRTGDMRKVEKNQKKVKIKI